MASLEEIIKNLGREAKEKEQIATRVLKIKGLKRIVVQLNAIPENGKIRYSMTLHSVNNYRKQIGITANDAEDFLLIGQFLEKYAEVLNEYIKFTPRNSNTPQEEEIELENNDNNETKKPRKKNVEEEF